MTITVGCRDRILKLWMRAALLTSLSKDGDASQLLSGPSGDHVRGPDNAKNAVNTKGAESFVPGGGNNRDDERGQRATAAVRRLHDTKCGERLAINEAHQRKTALRYRIPRRNIQAFCISFFPKVSGALHH